MALLTTQALQTYYSQYSKIDITLNKDVMHAIGFVGDDVYLKVGGMQWPCVIYSTSMEAAKVVVSFKPEHLERLRTGTTNGSLRYSFNRPERQEHLKFFVNVKVRGFNRYSTQRQDLYFVTLDFTQKPPEDLIAIVGTFLEININSKKRANERIPVREDNIRKLGFASTTCVVYIDLVPRKCLLKDMSFGGCLLLVPGLAKYLHDKAVILRLMELESGNKLDVAGKIVRVDPVEGRKDIALLAVQFDEARVPMIYKKLISAYLRGVPRGT